MKVQLAKILSAGLLIGAVALNPACRNSDRRSAIGAPGGFEIGSSSLGPEAPQIMDRGQDFTVFESVSDDGTGQRTNRFVLLENGLNYFENGQWQPSEDVIENFPEGLVARRSPVRAVFSHDLSAPAVFDLEGPNGLRLRGGIRSLHLTDTSNGRSVLLGTVRESVPATFHPPNVIVFEDAVQGDVQADVVLTWRHNAFSHDVVLRSRPRLPADFAPESTRLEVATEFLDQLQPRVEERVIRRGGRPDFFDVPVVRFGGLDIVLGRAFPVDETGGVSLTAQNERTNAVPVAKQWQREPDGRSFLFESVPWPELQPHLERLAVSPASEATGVITAQRALPALRERSAVRTVAKLSSAPYQPTGYVLDFVIVPETSPTTFLSGTEYIIRTSYYLGSAATFQSGCIVKYHSVGFIMLYGPSITFPSTGARCVFTSLDDDRVGTKFPGSSSPYVIPASDGNPFDQRAVAGIWIQDVNYSTLVQNAHFRFSATGIYYWGTGPSANHTVNNCIFEHITAGGSHDALTISIDPARTVTINNSTNCNVDRDYELIQGATPVGALVDDCGPVNASATSSHQLEPAAVVRRLPGSSEMQIVIIAMHRDVVPPGLLWMRSNDSGKTWTRQIIANGVSGDNMLPAEGDSDPCMTYDSFGNFFLAYRARESGTVITALYISQTGGVDNSGVVDFQRVTGFTGAWGIDEMPRVATGKRYGSTSQFVWLVLHAGGTLRVLGREVTGLNTFAGNWNIYDIIVVGGSPSERPLFGQPAVGPNGEFALAYISATGSYPYPPPIKVRVRVEIDGSGPISSAEKHVVNSNVGWEVIPANGGLDFAPIPRIDWDRINNRIYLVYLNRSDVDRLNTDSDVFLEASPDKGDSWSDPIRLNNDSTERTQFHPALAVDQSSGMAAVGWYDCRDDPLNIKTHFFLAIDEDKFQAANQNNFKMHPLQIDGTVRTYKEYVELKFVERFLVPIWLDNSVSANDFEIYCAPIKF